MIVNQVALTNLVWGVVGAIGAFEAGLSADSILDNLTPSLQEVQRDPILSPAIAPIQSFFTDSVLTRSVERGELVSALRQAVSNLSSHSDTNEETARLLSWSEERLSPLDPESRPPGMTLMADDPSLPLIRSFIEASPLPVGVFEITEDHQIRFLMFNEGHATISGFPKAHMTAETFLATIHSDDQKRFEKLIECMCQLGFAYADNIRLTIPDNGPIWVDISAGLIKGTTMGYLTLISKEALKQTIEGQCALEAVHREPDIVGIDTVQRQRVVETLCTSQSVFRNMAQPLAIFHLDEAGHPSLVLNSLSLEEMLGYSRAEMRELTLKEVFPEEHLPELKTRLKSFRETGAFEWLGAELLNKAGERISVDISARTSVVSDQTYGMVLLANAWERKERERQQIDAESAEAFQILILQMVHDVNNLLLLFNRLLEFEMGRALKKEVVDLDALSDLRFELLEYVELIDEQLTDFSGMTTGREPDLVDLHNLLSEQKISSMLGMLESRVESGTITYDRKMAEDIHLVKGPRFLLFHVILNLMKNACEAMRGCERRHLAVETTMITLSRPDLIRMNIDWRLLGNRPSDFIRLRIQDTGQGIPADQLRSIFDVFYTTKEGTIDNRQGKKKRGIGLSSVKTIVEGMGGFITVDSTPGKGTRFDIYLPRIELP